MGERQYRIQPNGLPAQILDLLDIDPGWWTTSAVCMRFNTHKSESVRRALIRLNKAGLLQSRERLLNEVVSGAYSPEHEYRVN